MPLEHDQDEQHLRLLSIFHFVLGGVTALFSLFPIFHLGFGIFMLAGGFDGANGPPRALGVLFVAVAGTMMILGFTLAALILLNGLKLRQRKRYTFCFVTACLECTLMPLGTVLGVFTILVLSRQSVKDKFIAVAE